MQCTISLLLVIRNLVYLGDVPIKRTSLNVGWCRKRPQSSVLAPSVYWATPDPHARPTHPSLSAHAENSQTHGQIQQRPLGRRPPDTLNNIVRTVRQYTGRSDGQPATTLHTGRPSRTPASKQSWNATSAFSVIRLSPDDFHSQSIIGWAGQWGLNGLQKARFSGLWNPSKLNSPNFSLLRFLTCCAVLHRSCFKIVILSSFNFLPLYLIRSFHPALI